MPALLFTKENPFKLYNKLQKSKSSAPAKAGQTAPSEIVVPKGPTPFAPGPIIGELGALGIKTAVENIKKRSMEEVAFHFGLHKKLFKKLIDTDRFMKDGIRFNVIGRMEMLPKDEQELIKQAMEKTKDNDKHVFTACIAYNGQDEIVDACKKLIEKGVKPEEVDREMIKQNIYTHDLPAPDLIVRTGMDPDARLSGFLLWDSSYAEFAFTKTKWPGLTEEEVGQIIEDYAERKRRKGGN